MEAIQKLKFEPVPKPHGFSTGSWKKRTNRTKVRPAFSRKSKVAVPKLKFWNSLVLEWLFL
jgi:hypothetical protein